jgi:MFS family permease
MTNSSAAFGVFQTYYTTALGEEQSTISWVGSVQLWVVFFMSAFSGRALDAGLFIPTFAIGVAIQLFGMFMTSLCTVFWQLVLAQGICTGLGSGSKYSWSSKVQRLTSRTQYSSPQPWASSRHTSRRTAASPSP